MEANDACLRAAWWSQKDERRASVTECTCHKNWCRLWHSHLGMRTFALLLGYLIGCSLFGDNLLFFNHNAVVRLSCRINMNTQPSMSSLIHWIRQAARKPIAFAFQPSRVSPVSSLAWRGTPHSAHQPDLIASSIFFCSKSLE